MRSKMRNFNKSVPYFFNRWFSGNVLSVRRTEVADLINNMEGWVHPLPNVIYFNAYPTKHAHFALQYLTAYSAATYQQDSSLVASDNAIELCDKYSGDLIAILEEKINKEFVSSELQKLQELPYEQFLKARHRKIQPPPVAYDVLDKASNWLSTLSAIAQDVDEVTQKNTVYRPSDVWEVTKKMLFTNYVQNEQLRICKKFTEESMSIVSSAETYEEEIAKDPLHAVVLTNSAGHLNHYVVSDSEHLLFNNLFKTSASCPSIDAGAADCIIDPSQLLESYKRVVELPRYADDYRVAPYAHEDFYMRPGDSSKMKNEVIANRMMHTAHEIATQKRFNVVVMGRGDSPLMQYPFYVSPKLTANVTVRKVKREKGSDGVVMNKHIVNFANSTAEVGTTECDTLLDVNGYTADDDEFIFSLSLSDKKIHIADNSHFQPLSDWSKQDFQLFFMEKRRQFGFGDAVVYKDNLVSLKYVCGEKVSKHYSSVMRQREALRYYAWYDPVNSELSVTDSAMFNSMGVGDHFFKNVDIAKGPVANCNVDIDFF